MGDPGLAGGLAGADPLELNVEPIGPNLMFEKVTEALGLFVSTSSGVPDEVGHAPREIPGVDGSMSVG